MIRTSDRQPKDDFVEIGLHPRAFGIRQFECKQEFQAGCATGQQFGVMDDEEECSMPNTISVGLNACNQADHSRSGIIFAA